MQNEGNTLFQSIRSICYPVNAMKTIRLSPLRLTRMDCSRGAPMGRTSVYPVTSAALRFRLVRVRLDSGGYDNGGAYWGYGRPGRDSYYPKILFGLPESPLFPLNVSRPKGAR